MTATGANAEPMSAPSNIAELTVSELSSALKRTIEDAYGYVRVRGEISGYRGPHSSGHAYFSLKDSGAKIDAVVWKGVFGRLRFKPEEGLEVVATGKLTTYAGSSKYQIVIDGLEPAGAGALMVLLEERRRKLLAEGLFDAGRKQLLPELPRVIGVVTSPTGAVIRDILHRIADRFPVHVLVWPVRVQGETSAAEVAAAIAGFNALEPGGSIPRPDVIVVARGGGSLEDLWSFNEEIVVRAAAASAIPLVSAVGHETDTTLIDFASDVRAPTPTAAAELVVPVRTELLAGVEDFGLRLARAAGRALELKRRELAAAARALPRPDALLAVPRQRLDTAGARLPRALVAEIRGKRVAYSQRAGRLSPAALETFVKRERLRFAQAAARGHRAFDVLLARRRDRFGPLGRRLVPDLLEGPVIRQRERIAALAARGDRAFESAVRRRSERLDALDRRLVPELLERPVIRQRERLAPVAARAARAFDSALRRRSDRLGALGALLRSLSYRGVLARGFALIRGSDGAALRTAASVPPGARLDIEFADGRVAATADGTKAPKPPRPKSGSEQDDLFG